MARMPADYADPATGGRAGALDEELLSGFLRGEEHMFAELVQRHERSLYTFIARFTGRQAEAPDLFQETFVRVFQHADSFSGRSSFKTWLYAIALNVCRTHARKAPKRQTALDPADALLVSPAPGPNGTAAREEIGKRIAGAVAGLPDEQREVFILKAYDEMKYGEIADSLGRPLGTVKSQMRVALRKMRAALRDIAEAYGIAQTDSA